MNKTYFLWLFLCLSVFSGCYRSFESERGLVKLPLSFDPEKHCAALEVEIESKKYPLQIDTGEFADLVLLDYVLKDIKCKIEREPVASLDIKNNRYLSPSYEIPQAKILNIEFRDPIVVEESDEFLRNSLFQEPVEQEANYKTSREVAGRIGRGFFQHRKLLFVFPGFLFDVDNPSFLNTFFEVPCEISDRGILLKMDTDLGSLTFLLDSGSTHSTLNADLIEMEGIPEIQPGVRKINSHRSIMGSRDFGTISFYVFNADLRFPHFDGILGIDFFLTHTIYIDFELEKIFLRKRK
ncbi:MAG: hypothetical protein JSS32_02990 [Verrucomicrobia bacterium]|nr:hypothetical protein [Verrucomicrobiota bacterium]